MQNREQNECNHQNVRATNINRRWIPESANGNFTIAAGEQGFDATCSLLWFKTDWRNILQSEYKKQSFLRICPSDLISRDFPMKVNPDGDKET